MSRPFLTGAEGAISFEVMKKSLSEAGRIVGVQQQTVARWVRTGKLKAKVHKLGGMMVKMVELAEVKKLAKGITRGRPRMDGRRK